MVSVFLTYFTQYDNLQLHLGYCKWHYFLVCSIPVYICTRSLSIHLWMNIQVVGLLDHKVILFLVLLVVSGKPLYCFPQCLYELTFSTTLQASFLFSTSSPAFGICSFYDGHSDHCEVVPHCSFDLHFSNIISNQEHLL